MSCDDLEVGEGTEAGLAWAHFIDPSTEASEKANLKRALLKYCALDTLGMVKLVKELRGHSVHE